MERRRSPRLTYANVTAALALVVAGGGAAYTLATLDSADHVDESADESVDESVEESLGGDQPPAGPDSAGDTGDSAGRQRVDSGNADLPGHGDLTLTVDCPQGTVAVSGGTWANHPGVRVTWAQAVDADTYAAAFENPTREDRRVGVHAICETS